MREGEERREHGSPAFYLSFAPLHSHRLLTHRRHLPPLLREQAALRAWLQGLNERSLAPVGGAARLQTLTLSSGQGAGGAGQERDERSWLVVALGGGGEAARLLAEPVFWRSHNGAAPAPDADASPLVDPCWPSRGERVV